MVTQSDSLPAEGVTDQLHVVGDCEGLYLHTGDAYEPWVLVERRANVVVVDVQETIRPGRTPLFIVHATKDRFVQLETKRDHYARVVIANEDNDGVWGFGDCITEAEVASASRWRVTSATRR